MPAHRLMTGLADQRLCLHRLVRKKKEREKKENPGPSSKDITVNPPPRAKFTSLLEGGGPGVLGTKPQPGRLGWV